MSGKLSPSEVATLIEKGLSLAGKPSASGDLIEECRDRYLDVDFFQEKKYLACVLGLAIIGMYGDPQLAYQKWCSKLDKTRAKGSEIAAEILGMSPRLAETLDLAHQGEYTATQLVRKLKIGDV
jgi:hypothetical protein